MTNNFDAPLRRLTSRLGNPKFFESLRKSDYDKLMNNLGKLDQTKRVDYINCVLNWLSLNNGTQFTKKFSYFGLDLEHQIGYDNNTHDTVGDILGLELKCQSIAAKSALRLTTKLGSEIANTIQKMIQEKCRKEIKLNYQSVSQIVYYGDAYSFHNKGQTLNSEERKEHGYILQNGEVLKNGVENKLGRFKFKVWGSRLIFFIRPNGYRNWIKKEVGINLNSVFSKFENGFVYCLHYPRERKQKNVLLTSFHVNLSITGLIQGIRDQDICLEIRYGGGSKGKYQNSGDAFQISRSKIEKLLFNTVLAKPITNGYSLVKIN